MPSLVFSFLNYIVAPIALISASGTGDDSVTMFFGFGCYWGSQNLLVEQFERAVLDRADDEITSVAGYAGSMQTGPAGQVCYYNDQNISYYATMGQGEVTQVEVPRANMQEAFAAFFGAFREYSPGLFGRPDYFDRGAGYREQLGFPGGVSNDEIMEAVRAANLINLTLLEGVGADPDTLITNNVYIVDSDKFAFAQAEICMQFYDYSDQDASENASYIALRPILEAQGRFEVSTCPSVYLCNGAIVV